MSRTTTRSPPPSTYFFSPSLVCSTLQHETGVTMLNLYANNLHTALYLSFFSLFSMRRAAVCSFHTHTPCWPNGSFRPALFALFLLSHPVKRTTPPSPQKALSHFFIHIRMHSCKAPSAVNNNESEGSSTYAFLAEPYPKQTIALCKASKFY